MDVRRTVAPNRGVLVAILLVTLVAIVAIVGASTSWFGLTATKSVVSSQVQPTSAPTTVPTVAPTAEQLPTGDSLATAATKATVKDSVRAHMTGFSGPNKHDEDVQTVGRFFRLPVLSMKDIAYSVSMVPANSAECPGSGGCYLLHLEGKSNDSANVPEHQDSWIEKDTSHVLKSHIVTDFPSDLTVTIFYS